LLNSRMVALALSEGAAVVNARSGHGNIVFTHIFVVVVVTILSIPVCRLVLSLCLEGIWVVLVLSDIVFLWQIAIAAPSGRS
jgi:hypothetical protein